MNIAVLGLWHLGAVTAAGAARAGHQVAGWDPSAETVSKLRLGIPPLFEPGLDLQLKEGLSSGKLSFESDLGRALSGKELVWIAFDTPVDSEDRADALSVANHIKKAAPLAERGALILISSQLPAGTGGSLAKWLETIGRSDLEIACSPENLRLGQALKIFSDPDRVICGASTDSAKKTLSSLFDKITGSDRIVWMSVISAEMTKHAINAFLALSVSYANEIASLCEALGADAREVERGLKTEKRIGPGAYLGPGPAFAGGTLARDLAFLKQLGESAKRPLPVIAAAGVSNDLHKNWIPDRLRENLGALTGLKITLWGLAYKPGTDTLRRSASLETADRLISLGASVSAHDPRVKALPAEWRSKIALIPKIPDSIRSADALVICTPHPEYLKADKNEMLKLMKNPLIIDPSGFLRELLAEDDRIAYVSVGYVKKI